MVFQGVPQYKNVSYPVTFTDNGEATSVMGYNLVANPFTCAVDASSFLTHNSSSLSEETIWIWDDYASNSGGGDDADYITINDLGVVGNSRNERGDDWDGTINVAQGFFVKAASSSTVTFNQVMKTLDGNGDDSYFRTTQFSVEKYWFGLERLDGLKGTNTLVGFHPEATSGFDKRFDASRLGGAFGLFTVLNGEKLAIQGLPADWAEEGKVVKLGYQAVEAGTYVLSIEKSENADGSTHYLTDHLLGVTTLLTSGSYIFDSEAGTFNERFSLSHAALNTEEVLSSNAVNDIVVYVHDRSIKVACSQSGSIKVWSVSGQMIHKGVLSNDETAVAVGTGGLYVVSVETLKGVSTYKVAVKN